MDRGVLIVSELVTGIRQRKLASNPTTTRVIYNGCAMTRHGKANGSWRTRVLPIRTASEFTDHIVILVNPSTRSEFLPKSLLGIDPEQANEVSATKDQ